MCIQQLNEECERKMERTLNNRKDLGDLYFLFLIGKYRRNLLVLACCFLVLMIIRQFVVKRGYSQFFVLIKMLTRLGHS